jgi:hypothetical protein
MGNVVDLFTQKPIPAAKDSTFVEDFTNEELGDLLSTIEALTTAETEERFRYYLTDIQQQVRGWQLD